MFICTHNSARSQIAEGLVNALFPDRYEAFSAGTEPLEVHPLAIQVMKEIGIDISGHRSKSLDEFRGRELDYVVTVCDKAHQKCPFFPGGKIQMHQGFGDPASTNGTDSERFEAFRMIRDELRTWLESTFGSKKMPEHKTFNFGL